MPPCAGTERDLGEVSGRDGAERCRLALEPRETSGRCQGELVLRGAALRWNRERPRGGVRERWC